jgi:dihydrofolate reductase
VLSSTLTEATWPTARIVHTIDEIAALRQQKGNAVYVVGGPGLLASLIDADLLDELRLIVHPVLAGDGRSFLAAIAPRRELALVAAEPMDSGRVNLTYRFSASTAA